MTTYADRFITDDILKKQEYKKEKFIEDVFSNHKYIKPEIEYLGLPYTTEDKFLLNYRAEVSNLIASKLMKEDMIIFAPISAWHHVALKYELPLDFNYWKKLDEEFIKVSKKLLIIQLPGWDTSKGVNFEIEVANHYNVPIEYINPYKYIPMETYALKYEEKPDKSIKPPEIEY